MALNHLAAAIIALRKIMRRPILFTDKSLEYALICKNDHNPRLTRPLSSVPGYNPFINIFPTADFFKRG